jgi:hypothetical protein
MVVLFFVAFSLKNSEFFGTIFQIYGNIPYFCCPLSDDGNGGLFKP